MNQDQIIAQLLQNRGLVTTQQIGDFFSPNPPDTYTSPFDSAPAIQLIKQHIQNKSKIAIFGDYDVDGVCATAILWETLRQHTPDIFPHIPHRKEEGYGLSKKGIDMCLQNGAKLIIAVDNGIVAIEQIAYARSQGSDCIVIDHHEKADSLPPANVILHSTSSCAACLVWLFCRDFDQKPNLEHLSLTALAVICDMIPLLGMNRSFATYGLQQLKNTRRPGLVALCIDAGFNPSEIDAYKVGFVIGPRLNAMGRLEHALDSLRLLCTTSPDRARDLAITLSETNKSRQELTSTAVDHALLQIPTNMPNLLVVADESYEEGIIGLVASKLVEKYYRPALAISVGPETSKGSARSIVGFHVTDHLRSFFDTLTAVGGHAMAAGFSLPTVKLQHFITEVSQVYIDNDTLKRKQRVDTELKISQITPELVHELQKFAPFGLGNPQPVFQTTSIAIENLRRLGQNGKHLKFQIQKKDAIYFNAPSDLEISKIHSAIYSLQENTYNGKTNLQLVVKSVDSQV